MVETVEEYWGTVDKMGRIYLPKGLQSLLRVRPGDEIEFETVEDSSRPVRAIMRRAGLTKND